MDFMNNVVYGLGCLSLMAIVGIFLLYLITISSALLMSFFEGFRSRK